jgi:hypothetical protein
MDVPAVADPDGADPVEHHAPFWRWVAGLHLAARVGQGSYTVTNPFIRRVR